MNRYKVTYTFVYEVEANSSREAEHKADNLLLADSDEEHFLDMIEDCDVKMIEK